MVKFSNIFWIPNILATISVIIMKFLKIIMERHHKETIQGILKDQNIFSKPNIVFNVIKYKKLNLVFFIEEQNEKEISQIEMTYHLIVMHQIVQA